MRAKILSGLAIIGVAAYVIWWHFTISIVIAFVVAAFALGWAWHNRPDRRLREGRSFWVGMAALAVGALFLASGRQQIGAIGAGLIVLAGVVAIFLTILGHD